jgi:hypothetical protein
VYGLVYSTTVQNSIPNGGQVAFEQTGPFAGVTPTITGFTIQSSGIYQVQATCGSTNANPIKIAVNGAATAMGHAGTSTGLCGPALAVVPLGANDTVSLVVGGVGATDVRAPGSDTGGPTAVLSIVKLA